MMIGMDYSVNREWADRRNENVKTILYERVGRQVLQIAPEHMDRMHATDLNVRFSVLPNKLDIGVRIRRPGYATQYPWDFTVRYNSDPRFLVEYDKLHRGDGDWNFYGHVDEMGNIPRWMIVDLHVFRYHLHNNMSLLDKIVVRRSNRDGGSELLAFDVRRFPQQPKHILVDCSDSMRRDNWTVPYI